MATNEFDITDLLTSKSFEELTENERAMAIAELGSEEAYREMYDIVQGTADLDAPKMTSSNRNKTFAAFDELHKEEPTKKRGIIWLKPFVIGLAAATILGFIWIVGFSDLNKDNTLAENKPMPKKEVKDSTTTNEATNDTKPAKKVDVAENAEFEAEANTETEASEDIKKLDTEEFILEAIPAALDDSNIIAEKKKAVEAKAEKDKAENIIEEKAHSPEFIEEELAEYQDEHYNEYNDLEISSSEAQGIQPATTLESASTMRSGSARKKSADSQEINMNSNISKQNIFKVKLPLRNHYTAY